MIDSPKMAPRTSESDAITQLQARKEALRLKQLSQTYNNFVRNIQGGRTAPITYNDVQCICFTLIFPFSDEEYNVDFTRRKAVELYRSLRYDLTPVEQVKMIARQCKHYAMDHCRCNDPIIQASVVIATLLHLDLEDQYEYSTSRSREASYSSDEELEPVQYATLEWFRRKYRGIPEQADGRRSSLLNVNDVSILCMSLLFPEGDIKDGKTILTELQKIQKVTQELIPLLADIDDVDDQLQLILDKCEPLVLPTCTVGRLLIILNLVFLLFRNNPIGRAKHVDYLPIQENAESFPSGFNASAEWLQLKYRELTRLHRGPRKTPFDEDDISILCMTLLFPEGEIKDGSAGISEKKKIRAIVDKLEQIIAPLADPHDQLDLLIRECESAVLPILNAGKLIRTSNIISAILQSDPPTPR